MQTMDEILQNLRRLAPDEREQVRAELDALEQAEKEENGGQAPTEDGREAAMQDWLAVAGTFHSDFADVSTDKYKHLGDVYADKR
jgi:DNA-binding GntR family transcriptional regulator